MVTFPAGRLLIGPEQRPPLTDTVGPFWIENWKLRPDMPLAELLQISMTLADAAWAPTARTPTVAIPNRTASRRSPLLFTAILPLPLSAARTPRSWRKGGHSLGRRRGETLGSLHLGGRAGRLPPSAGSSRRFSRGSGVVLYSPRWGV